MYVCMYQAIEIGKIVLLGESICILIFSRSFISMSAAAGLN